MCLKKAKRDYIVDIVDDIENMISFQLNYRPTIAFYFSSWCLDNQIILLNKKVIMTNFCLDGEIISALCRGNQGDAVLQVVITTTLYIGALRRDITVCQVCVKIQQHCPRALATSLPLRFTAHAGNADMIQPGLIPLQPNLDFMDSFDPLQGSRL